MSAETSAIRFAFAHAPKRFLPPTSKRSRKFRSVLAQSGHHSDPCTLTSVYALPLALAVMFVALSKSHVHSPKENASPGQSGLPAEAARLT